MSLMWDTLIKTVPQVHAFNMIIGISHYEFITSVKFTFKPLEPLNISDKPEFRLQQAEIGINFKRKLSLSPTPFPETF